MPDMPELRTGGVFLRPWWPALLLGGLWCILQALGGPALWGYERQAIEAGRIWRLLSGQFVHLNAVHLGLNLLGLAGVMAVWARELTPPLTLLTMVLGSAWSVGLGLWWFVPEVDWYVGASGVLHGLFAAGIVLATGVSRGLRAVATLGLVLKLVVEAHLDTGSAELIGAPVIHTAHQFGALGGLLSALFWQIGCDLKP